MDLAQALLEADKMIDRDEQIMMLLGRHKVATTDQLTRAFFPSGRTARERLKELYDRDVFARFRGTCPGPGSLPFVYCLGVHGAVLYAAADEDRAMPTTAEVNRRITRLRCSATLGHQLAVVDFFTRLLAVARQSGDAFGLEDWLPEAEAATECGGIVRPDAYAEWREPTDPHHPHGPDGPEPVGFFFELDTGTERPIDRLMEKIDRYATVAAAAEDEQGEPLPVLFQLPNPTRETHFHDALTRRYGPRGPRAVPVATTTADRAAGPAGPAGPIWWPAGTHGRRVRLTRTADPAGWGGPA